jgi:hypothetical protein
MTLRRRAAALAIAALGLCGCATVRPLPPGPVREIIPRVGDREVMLTDRSGRFFRLTAVRLVGDSVVGLSIEDAHRVALAADDVQQVRVFGNDPITSVASSYGVFLILIGAVAVLGLVTHLAAR